MKVLKDIFFYPLLEIDGFNLALINLVIFVGLFLLGKIVILYLRRFVKSQELDDKKFTVEGKDIPIWRLSKQLIWLAILFGGYRSLYVNNTGLESSNILEYEFFRFDKFHLAVYHFFVIVLLYFGGRITFSVIRIYLLRRIKKSNRLDQGTEYVYFQLIKYFIICVSIILMLRTMGVDLNTFLQSMLFLSVGVALGLQDIFRDLFGGFLLLFEGTVKVGDIVEIDRPGGQENFVARILEINMRTSKVETIEGKTLIVPNSHLTAQRVNNWSNGKPATRFSIPLTVAYNADLEVVKACMVRAARAHPKVLKGKEVFVRLLQFGDRGYVVDLIFWANQNFQIDVHKSDIRFAIDAEFKKHGIHYPYPQLDLHVKPDPRSIVDTDSAPKNTSEEAQ